MIIYKLTHRTYLCTNLFFKRYLGRKFLLEDTVLDKYKKDRSH